MPPPPLLFLSFHSSPFPALKWNVPLVARSVRGLLITPAVALHGGGDARCRTRNRARLAELGREGGRDVNLEGEGRSRSLGERARRPLIPSARCSGRACNGALTSTAPPLLTSVLPSFLPGHPHSLHRRMKSCLRSAHSLTRGIRTIPEVEPWHGCEQSLQSPVQCLRKSTE